MTIPHRFVGGALDLGELKARADARRQAQNQQQAGGDSQASPGAGAVEAFFEVTPAHFEEDVARRSTQVPVILLLGQGLSPDTQDMKVTLQAIAAQANGAFVVGVVDLDQHPEFAQVFGIRAVPTVVALAQGQPVASFEGVHPAETVQQWVGQLVAQVGPQLAGLPQQREAEEPADPRLAQAEAALQAGDFTTAVELYQALVAEHPGDQDMQRLLGFAQVGQRVAAAGGVQQVLAAEVAADDLSAALLRADAQLLSGQTPAAFADLTSVLSQRVRAGDAAGRDAVRDHLVGLFALFPADDAQVLQARAAMANALF